MGDYCEVRFPNGNKDMVLPYSICGDSVERVNVAII